MRKEEILYLHQFLAHLINCLGESNEKATVYFEKYRQSGIKPNHFHRPKSDHLYAIFTLSAGISDLLSKNTELMPANLSKGLEKLAEKNKRKKRRR